MSNVSPLTTDVFFWIQQWQRRTLIWLMLYNKWEIMIWPLSTIRSDIHHKTPVEILSLSVCFQSAIRLKPGFTDAYNNMASALVQKGLIPQAMECYMTALRLDPNLVRFCHDVASALQTKHMM